MQKIPESAIVSACIKYLWALGCYVWRNNSGAYRPDDKRLVRYGKTGSADIIGVTPGGRFIACECKSAKGKQTEAQIDFQIKVEANNGIYILARSCDDIESHRQEIVA